MREKVSIKELLNGVEVEWKSVLEIIDDKFWIMPSTPKFDENEKIPYITSKNIKNGHINFDKVKYISYLDYLEISQNRPILAGDILISMIGTIGEVARVKEKDLEFYGQNMYLIRLNNNLINSDYFLHFFDSPKMKNHFASVKNNSGQGYLKAKDIDNLLIPIPYPNNLNKSLEVQNEIVRILDNFTDLTAELTKDLTAELTAREKQYQFYRDKLLSFENTQVEYKKLNSLSEYPKTRISYEQLDTTNYIGVDNLLQNREGKVDSSKVPTSGNVTKFSHNDILIGNIRPYLKKIWFADRTGGASGDVLVIRLKSNQNINLRFLYQVLSDDKFFEYNMKHAKGAKMPRGNKLKIMEYEIPIPYPNDPDKSLEEQQRIVDILDEFDSLISSISESLSKEILLRQRQYEYYRDLLLNFKR